MILVMGFYFLYFIEYVYRCYDIFCLLRNFTVQCVNIILGQLQLYLFDVFTIESSLLKMTLILNWYHNKITNGRCIQVVEIGNCFVIILQQLYLIQWCYTLHGIIYGKLR